MIRRLDEDELARTPARPVLEATPDSLERRRAASVVAGLRDYMREQLALEEPQIEDFTLALERALLLSAREPT